MTQVVPIYLNNLDRRDDRRHYMQTQFEALGLTFERHAAWDARTVSDSALRHRVNREASRIFMSKASACNALSHLSIHAQFLASDTPVALVVEDDIELSRDIVPLVSSSNWLPKDVGVVQLEQSQPRPSKKLIGPALETPCAGRTIHKLYSRMGGSASYFITRSAAQKTTHWSERLRTPIDHFLFSPNMLPVFCDLGVAVILPALGRQNEALLGSDIAELRDHRPKSRRHRILRAYSEFNQLPWQVAQMVCGARWKSHAFRA